MHAKRVLVTGGSGFIGTNLIENLVRAGNHQILNLDQNEPREKSHRSFWQLCNLTQGTALTRHLQDFRPTQVVHLAGRTDMFGKTVDDYAANHIGTALLAAAIKQAQCVERVIFTSSQFVVGPGALPAHDMDFRPHTIYGESKVLSEKEVRAAGLTCMWTIIRPTNIWGKWHPRYPEEFWKILRDGKYLHPGGENVMRCYGYVGNVVEQIQKILAAETAVVDRKVFYVGDPAINLFDWANAFSLELTGKQVRIVPRTVLIALAKIGDLVNLMGGRFPLFSSRYRSMTESYLTPMQPTFAALGEPRISLEQGVHETGEWLRSLDPAWQ